MNSCDRSIPLILLGLTISIFYHGDEPLYLPFPASIKLPLGFFFASVQMVTGVLNPQQQLSLKTTFRILGMVKFHGCIANCGRCIRNLFVNMVSGLLCSRGNPGIFCRALQPKKLPVFLVLQGIIFHCQNNKMHLVFRIRIVLHSLHSHPHLT